MKRLAAIITLLIISFNLPAQSSLDALRYSRMNYQGTARFNAMGGSFGALGGEASAIIVNPASIGVYRNSEFTFSLGMFASDQETIFDGNISDDQASLFHIPNISFVSTYRGNDNGWRYYSLGFGHNRINNFQREYTFSGENFESSSFLDPYVADLNFAFPNTDDLLNYQVFPFGPAQAFETFAIDTFRNAANELFYDRWLLGEESIEQGQIVRDEGKQAETYISFGGNYRDRLYLGANVGVQNLRFERQLIRFEEYNYATPPPFGVTDINDYREESNLRITGTGFNFKFGMILRLTESIRLGASVHTPTYYVIDERFNMEGRSSFSDGNSFESTDLQSDFSYLLRTPLRLNASLAYVHGRTALINIDYEYVDYTEMKYDDHNRYQADFSTINTEIGTLFQETHSLRMGMELRFDPIVLRGGLKYEGNPFAEGITLEPDESRRTYSLGTGYRMNNFNFDLAYVFSRMDFIDTYYEGSPNTALVQRDEHLISATVGWKW